jgi:hypothetical protein
MSKNAKTFLPIAAAIAIPFVAGPLGVALSSSMLLSGTALGTFLASAGGAAALGGLMGAGVGLAAGRGLEGALIGGATGALGGYAGAGGFAGLGEAASATAGTPSAIAPASATTAAAPSIPLAGAQAAAGVAPTAAGAVPVVTGAELASAIPGQLTGATAAAAPVGGLTGIPDLTTTAANVPTITGGPAGGTGVSRMLAGLGKAENFMPLMQAGMQFATADTGMSDAEQAAYNAQIAELERQGRTAEAMRLDQERRARTAEQMALQQGPRTAEAYSAGQLAAEQQLQGNLRRAGVQGYSPQQMAALERSGSIGASQVAGTRAAQEQARGEGAMRAGLSTASSMYPTQPTVNAVPTAQFQAAQVLAQREEDYYGGLGDTLAGVAGRLAKQADNTSSSLYPTA